MKPFDFVNRSNADYIDRLYDQYQRDPRSLDDSWQAFFAGFDIGSARNGSTFHSSIAPGIDPDTLDEPHRMGIYDLVHSYRELGHFVATLDPLGHDRPTHPLLELNNFGMGVHDLDRQVGQGTFAGKTDGSLRDLIERLRQTYCGTLGVEYTNISDKSQRVWLQQMMEPSYNTPKFSADEQKSILFQLVAAEEFEHFLQRAFLGQKRFSLEGGESLVPLANTIVEEGSTLGAEKMIMAMAHRGRLNYLAHVLNKPYEILLSEFKETNYTPDIEGDSDVKYHLGYASERTLSKGQKVKVSLLPNPSHLELIDPIQQGIVRAQQTIFGDTGRGRVVPVTIHGDAAFTGQGVVSETLNLSELPGYRTGGTIHIIVNNQIGFTTPPNQGRFTPYPTDVAKMIQAPIFHVNGDDPEAVVHAARLAIGFRQKFKCDVFVDLWCYRRFGHNEVDEPAFTQPQMYRQIATHKSVRTIYADKLISAGVITPAEHDGMKTTVVQRLESAHKLAQEVRPRTRVPTFGGVWKGLGKAGADWSAKTGVPRESLNRIAEACSRVPQGFTVHPKLVKTLAARNEAVKTGKGIDWATAEQLAMGSLLLEGVPVRFTGQDAERGTFGHRHGVLHDYNTGQTYTPLANIAPDQPVFTIRNTMLSEFAVLGFEWGVASADPRRLVVWEAQFGDFVNGAQPMIDQIIAAAESKWRYMNGMVMLLPHGYEGQGPEHSNAYIERFLSLCAEENMQVIIPTTPAQYFHALRRQIRRKFRKPLVLMSPKSLLRYAPSFSRVEDLVDGQFQNVIDDPYIAEKARVKRVLLCSGKVYYAIAAAREKIRLVDTAIVRVEQLYPFPQKELDAVLARYRSAEELFWVQEEPQNRGAWTFIDSRVRDAVPSLSALGYIGREEAASPATGIHKMHDVEEEEIISHALNLEDGRRVAPSVAAEVGASVPASAVSGTSVAG